MTPAQDLISPTSSTPRPAALNETARGIETYADASSRRIEGYEYAANSPFVLTPGGNADNMSWATEDPRGSDGIGGLSSLDFNSGYSYFDELMRLLQGDM